MFTVLIFNCGSSSLSYKLFGFTSSDMHPSEACILVSGKGHRVGTTTTQLSFIEHIVTENAMTYRLEVPLTTYKLTAQLIIEFLTCTGKGMEVTPALTEKTPFKIDLIGHRFGHGGDEFEESMIVTPEIQQKLVNCLELAPIHNPIALSVIEICQHMIPHVPNYVTFDTTFHRTIPPEATTYAIPIDLAKKYHKFGFHGLSYSIVTREVENYLGGKGSLKDKKMVICHLGTGAGVSVDTTMGFSPLPGLVMSTRCGDIDASIPIDMVRLGKSPDEVLDILNKKSGLLGLSSLSSDLRDIYQVASNPSHPKCENCRLAFSVCIHRLRALVGSMISVLGGIDILAFTDGLGIEMPALRDAVCSNFKFCGISIDPGKNKMAVLPDKIGDISAKDSRVKVLVVPNDEELVIAVEGLNIAHKNNMIQ